MKVGLDPGHGGKDPGAVGRTTRIEEDDVVLSVVLEVERILQENGYHTVLTRRGDVEVSLQDRGKLLNAARCDIVVSVHVNSSPSTAASYVSTFIYGTGGNAEKLANKIQPRLVSATGWPNGGVRVKNLHMVRETKAPAVLVELGFISNSEQEKLLWYPSLRSKLALAIAQGIGDYAGKKVVV